MNPDLPEEAVAYGEAAQRAFASLATVDAARRAELDPSLRSTQVRAVLDSLGLDDLDPTTDLDVAAAAAELCRAAGRVVLPYPVVARLLRDRQSDRPFAVIASAERARVDHADLFSDWRVATVDGTAYRAAATPTRLGSRLGPFVGDLVPAGEDGAAAATVALAVTLSAWQILGAVERSVELAVEHVRGRVQFGQPIAEFQAVQFQLADAAVAVDGLRELCRFTLWRIAAAPPSAGTDALALRLHALEVARSVLRTTQQLHGAAGVCDEYDISVLCRHIQPSLRLPFSTERTVTELVRAVEGTGFDSLFPHGGRAS